ncbi:MAG TPA: c-type cytochrome [Burkholderiaceae bacterium]|nr:c-type cytochrome [Burkholderiaceae bacterium]
MHPPPAWRLLAAFALAALSVAARAAPDAAALYHNYCSVCHGDRGDGRSRATGALSTVPRDFTTESARRELTRERIARAIADGVPGTAMVGWKTQLSRVDIDSLAGHVLDRYVKGEATPAGATPAISGTRAHGGREADATAASTSAPTVDMTAGLPNGLKGDPKRGGAFYNANCATCHGARGDGAGPRAYFINPKPRNLIDAASRARFNRVALYAAVSEGRLQSEMPAWKQVATPQQIADVSEYVFQTFIRGAPTAQAAR